VGELDGGGGVAGCVFCSAEQPASNEQIASICSAGLVPPRRRP